MQETAAVKEPAPPPVANALVIAFGQNIARNLALWSRIVVSAPRARTPPPSDGAIGAIGLTLIAIVASMFLVDRAAADWARHLPEGFTHAFDQISNAGLSGWFLVPLGIVILYLAAVTSPSLPRQTQGVLAALVARFLFLFWAIAAPGLFATIVKRLIGRARPYMDVHGNPFTYMPFAWRPEYASLPSGHAATAASVAIAFGALWPRLRPVAWLYALVIMFARVVVLAHHPSDVIAGALVGIVGAALVRRWFAARRLVFCAHNLTPYAGPSRRRIDAALGCLMPPRGRAVPREPVFAPPLLPMPRLNPVILRSKSAAMTQTSGRDADPEIAVVVPVRNEAGNIAPLVDEIAAALGGRAFEIVFVNDGSKDATEAEISELMAVEASLRQIRHKQSCGQSAALRTGVTAARAEIIVTLDGDGQNDPAFLPALIGALEKGFPRIGLVAGQRVGRKASGFKKMQSRVANAVRAAVLKDGTRDAGCGLKAFRRELFMALPYFDGLHRFLPALVRREGFDVGYVDVVDRPRRHGASNYGMWDRLWVGILDLGGVWWLIRRRKRLPEAEEVSLAR